MKRIFYSILISFCIAMMSNESKAQLPERYNTLTQQADSLFNLKRYNAATLLYSEAFKSNNWMALPDDRYKAAQVWSMSGNKDSALFQLNRIATKANWMDAAGTLSDTCFKSLKSDPRWMEIIGAMKSNKDAWDAKHNIPVMKQLDSIYQKDQFHRNQIDSIAKQFGWESKELKQHWKIINEIDSFNVIAVSSILDKNGWLGYDVIGGKGSVTLFLVIQHANINIQDKYLPLLREAVKNKKANGANLALLEDRVALRHGNINCTAVKFFKIRMTIVTFLLLWKILIMLI